MQALTVALITGLVAPLISLVNDIFDMVLVFSVEDIALIMSPRVVHHIEYICSCLFSFITQNAYFLMDLCS
jgi:hypothetical protein